VGYGTSVRDMFEIRQFDEQSLLSEHVHLAFNAYSKEDVDAFYYKALASGGKCKCKPGFRPQYEDGYYAAFVIPDFDNFEESVYL